MGNCKCNKCQGLIPSQRGPAGRNGSDGYDGLDGVLDWQVVDLECLYEQDVISEEDDNDEITQELVNFWCETNKLITSEIKAYDDYASTLINTTLSLKSYLNDDYLGPIEVEIVTNPSNGTASVDSDNKTIIYIPDQDYTGSDIIVYKITDSLGNSDTASINITVASEEVTECTSIVGKTNTWLNVVGDDLYLAFQDVTNYNGLNFIQTNIQVEIYDKDNTLINTIYIPYYNPGEIQFTKILGFDKSSWGTIRTEFLPHVEDVSGQVCDSSSSVTLKYISDFYKSMYEDVDLNCLGIADHELLKDSEITQQLINAACSSNGESNNPSDCDPACLTCTESTQMMKINMFGTTPSPSSNTANFTINPVMDGTYFNNINFDLDVALVVYDNTDRKSATLSHTYGLTDSPHASAIRNKIKDLLDSCISSIGSFASSIVTGLNGGTIEVTSSSKSVELYITFYRHNGDSFAQLPGNADLVIEMSGNDASYTDVDYNYHTSNITYTHKFQRHYALELKSSNNPANTLSYDPWDIIPGSIQEHNFILFVDPKYDIAEYYIFGNKVGDALLESTDVIDDVTYSICDRLSTLQDSVDDLESIVTKSRIFTNQNVDIQWDSDLATDEEGDPSFQTWEDLWGEYPLIQVWTDDGSGNYSINYGLEIKMSSSKQLTIDCEGNDNIVIIS